MIPTGKRGKRRKPRLALWLPGAALLTVSCVGYLDGKGAAFGGTICFLGTVLLVISVFESRMEGKQVLSPGRAEITLVADGERADIELATGRYDRAGDLEP